jgi:hypothetical protein
MRSSLYTEISAPQPVFVKIGKLSPYILAMVYSTLCSFGLGCISGDQC